MEPRPFSILEGATLVAIVCLFVAGCGGGDSDESALTGTTITMTETSGSLTTPATTTGLTESEAEALAESMLLRLSDFPTGWRGDPHEEGGAQCGGLDELSERYEALTEIDSDDFAKGDTTEASSTAVLFPDEEAANSALNYVEGKVQGEGFSDCLADFLRGEGITFGEIRVGQVSFPTLGDRSSAWEVVVPVEVEGASGTVYADAVYIRTGSALSAVLFSDVFTPFDETERERLARVVAERMEAAAAELP
jgi:hypothetical protein